MAFFGTSKRTKALLESTSISTALNGAAIIDRLRQVVSDYPPKRRFGHTDLAARLVDGRDLGMAEGSWIIAFGGPVVHENMAKRSGTEVVETEAAKTRVATATWAMSCLVSDRALTYSLARGKTINGDLDERKEYQRMVERLTAALLLAAGGGSEDLDRS
jgi:predicted ATPase